jgi:alanine-glyoxylate transaminase/serine-glyoxylate transaminase/serine-pyruvate transaminase
MPDRVLRAMHRPAPDIYSAEFAEMVHGLYPDLRAVARDTEAHVAIYIANGHGAWEAALINVLAQGDRVLVLSSGHFARGWAGVARALGAQVEVIDAGPGGAIPLDRVEARLRDDRAGTIRAVLCVHVDTSNGVRYDVAAVRAAMDAAGHPALLMVDCIASLGCERFEMAAWRVDVMLAASQKGLMTPPGLGFVFFGARAAEARLRADRVTPYWDWRPRAAPEMFYQLFGGTAPTHHLYALREALTMLIHEEGIEAAWARHAVLARALWAAVDAWGRAGALEILVADPARRSHSVTALRTGGDHGTRLREWLAANAGVTLGIGLGNAAPDSAEWHRHFRIGHMGHLDAHMLLGVLGSLQAGLVALGIPHGSGGLDAAAAICARC